MRHICGSFFGEQTVFSEDLEVIRDIVCRDPAFRDVAAEEAMTALDAARDVDSFLLAAMRLFALAGNGHTRLIPNAAISVWPVRIVARGNGFVLHHAGGTVPLAAINDVPVGTCLTRLRTYLAGTPARQSVLAGIAMAWPAALGVQTVRYAAGGGPLSFGPEDLVPAAPFYPVAETGMPDPDQDAYAGPAQIWWDATHWNLRIAHLTEPLHADVVPTLLSRPDAGVLIDLRGNAGGDFTHVLPVIDVLRQRGPSVRCAVLVDRFTFSAAIVAAMLLQHYVGARLFGEEMGDGLQFWAEGGTVELPQTGAAVRWSNGWHDWEKGQADATTSTEIAAHMVATGVPRITPATGREAARAWLSA